MAKGRALQRLAKSLLPLTNLKTIREDSLGDGGVAVPKAAATFDQNGSGPKNVLRAGEKSLVNEKRSPILPPVLLVLQIGTFTRASP